MPYVYVPISSYRVAYYAGGQASGYAYRAIVSLYGQNFWAAAYFHRDPATLPDFDTPGTAHPMIHYLSEDFPRVIDLLRNESPLFFRYNDSGSGIASINTSTEAIGEGEAEGTPA